MASAVTPRGLGFARSFTEPSICLAACVFVAYLCGTGGSSYADAMSWLPATCGSSETNKNCGRSGES